jgi:enamine deaminase RidA (YjgF/YER057c/UK114 family)
MSTPASRPDSEGSRRAESRTFEAVQPDGWPRPLGYLNGACSLGRGERLLFVAGQIGWRPDGVFATDDLAEQFGQALANVLSVVGAAGGGPEHVARMTVYVTDLDTYRTSGKAIGAAWRATMGRNFPAMALVGVAGLVEPRAKVEIEATCLLPAAPSE